MEETENNTNSDNKYLYQCYWCKDILQKNSEKLGEWVHEDCPGNDNSQGIKPGLYRLIRNNGNIKGDNTKENDINILEKLKRTLNGDISDKIKNPRLDITKISEYIIKSFEESGINFTTDIKSRLIIYFNDGNNILDYKRSKDILHTYVQLIVDKRKETIEDYKKTFKDDVRQTIKDKIIIDAVPISELDRSEKDVESEQTITDFISIARELQDKVPLYYDDYGNLWVWKDTHWLRIERSIEDIEIMNLLRNNLNFLGFFNREKSYILDAVRMVAREREILNVPKEWINTLSGVYDISKEKDNIFHPSPEYFFSEPIPHKIGNSDDTPIIDKLFDEWVGNDKINLFETSSYCLYDEYVIHTLFALHGSGRNGKGQYVIFLSKLIGGSNLVASTGMIKRGLICSTTLDNLLSSRFESAKLYRKKLCIIDETSFEIIKDTSVIKRLTGGSPIPGEFKNGASFDFLNTAKIIVLTNNVPPSLDMTDAYVARWFITDFPNQFPDGKDIVNIITETEYENFLYKCLKGLKKILNSGFTGRGTIEERRAKYEERSNPFESFKKEYCIEDINTFEASSILFEKYKSYCVDRKVRAPSSTTNLNKSLKGIGYEINHKMNIIVEGRTTSITAVYGLKLREGSIQDRISRIDSVISKE